MMQANFDQIRWNAEVENVVSSDPQPIFVHIALFCSRTLQLPFLNCDVFMLKGIHYNLIISQVFMNTLRICEYD